MLFLNLQCVFTFLLIPVLGLPDLFQYNMLKQFATVDSDSDSDSDSLQEWAPVSASLAKGEKNYFEFSLNNSDSYSQFLQTYETFIFLSGSICSKPNNTDEDTALRLYYSFESEATRNFSTAQNADFYEGYLEGLALRPYKTDTGENGTYSTLYLMAQLVNTTTNDSFPVGIPDQERWMYQLSISQSDLVFQWDKRSWLQVVDTDYNSALLVTGNVTATAKTNSNFSIYDINLYDLYVYEDQYFNYFDDLELSHSLCAIQNGPALLSSVKYSDESPAENSSLSTTELGVHKSVTLRGGSAKEQFHITGLNSSTTYVAFLTKRLSSNSKGLNNAGGVLFSKQRFTTMEEMSCSLIFGLQFCDGIAYSVPSSSLLKYNEKLKLAKIYDSIAESYYSNFSYALQLIPCDTEQDAIYSPLRTCKDCAVSYKNWLCSVSIPRCTTSKTPFYIHREIEESRNDMLDKLINPPISYYEILPCIDTCRTMVRDCPAEFGFSCPNSKTNQELLLHSYNFYESQSEFITCNFVGNSNDLEITNNDDTHDD